MTIQRALAAIFVFLGIAATSLLEPTANSQVQAQAVQHAPPPPAAAADQVDETLRYLEANYLRAEMEDDATLAGSILAEDFVGIKSDGGVLNRSQVLDNLTQHTRKGEPYRIAAVNMQEHVFGDTACVTYSKIYTVPSSGISYSENVLHIFTQRNGKWQLQVSSPIPRPSR